MSTNRGLVSTSRIRRRSRTVSLLTGTGTGTGTGPGPGTGRGGGVRAALPWRIAVDRTSPVSTAACLVDTPSAVIDA
jgi:hypothetical protein